MNTAKECICKECGAIYTRTSNNQKFCSYKCRYKNLSDRGIYRENALRYNQEHNTNYGVGSGSQTGIGKKNHWYKNGIGLLNAYTNRIRIAFGKCNRCNINLREAKRGQWAIHHKDHDRTNNSFSNFELLCVNCHVNEHKSWNKTKRCIEKVQRLSERSRTQESSKRTASLKG